MKIRNNRVTSILRSMGARRLFWTFGGGLSITVFMLFVYLYGYEIGAESCLDHLHHFCPEEFEAMHEKLKSL